MQPREEYSYETPNSIYVQREAYTNVSEVDQFLEDIGLGARPTASLQSLIDMVRTPTVVKFELTP